MFLPPIRRSIHRALIAAATLFCCIPFSFPAARAQNSQAASQSAAVPPTDRARIEETLSSLNRGRSIGQVAISPDGSRLAWIQSADAGSEIRVAPLNDLDKSERVSAATSGQHCQEGEIVWSPNAKSLAFFSDCAKQDEQTDLYIAQLDGSPARRITELKGYAEAPAFSPDGKAIAFLYVEGATRPAGALAAMKPPAGVIGEDGVEIQRVAVAAVDAAKPAAPAFATPPDLHVFEFDWSPDSKSLAYIAADPPGENNWWVAKLYTQVLPDQLGAPSSSRYGRKGWEAEPKAILAPAEVSGPLHGLQIAVPRWSPDGNSIAFIGGLMSDQGFTGGDVWIVPAGGGEPRNLTPNRSASPAWIEWDGSQRLYVSELAGGNSRLVRIELHASPKNTGPEGLNATPAPPVFSVPASVGDGRLWLSLSATADRSQFVFHAGSFDHPAEIYAVRPGSIPDAAPNPAASSAASNGFSGLTQLTHINDGVEPAWGKSVSVDWMSDNFHVQGWLTLPKDYDPAKKYPLIVEVHGGPAAAVEPRWGSGGTLSPLAFSALGYFVLQPNPRGSYGQGEAFTQANRKDFGYGDLRDILAGVDTVLAKYPVDPNRVGVTGWSYGGFMTMFAVTQTQRFKAAVAGAGISNWQSYYGENSIGQWMIPYFGASVYDDPQAYARSSAIDFINRAKTPTLVVVGDRDGECPAPQSYEFWHALRDRRIPTQLVVYPNEGHGFVDSAHRRDVIERAAEWFARYMPPGP